MILKMFSVYDQKAEAFMPPFYVGTRGLAIRHFAQATNTADHNFNKYPGDYNLFEIGEWDDSNCKHFLKDAPENLGAAIQFIEHEETNSNGN